ncbi:MAG: peptidoglycan DD-metalloendopeptidase family protein [Syntrophales bacterium]
MTYNTKQAKGVYHRIKSGETLWSIGRAYQINIQDLAEINNISDPNLIKVNNVIFIPDADQVIDDVMSLTRRSEVPARTSKERASDLTAEPHEDKASQEDKSLLSSKTPRETTSGLKTTSPIVTKEQSIQFDRKRFIWPVKGKVISMFGIQPNGMYYNGIKIATVEGANVLAAADGTVIASDTLKGYGETMILKHEDNYATVYTNLGCRMRKVNDKVSKGDRIALSGNSEQKEEIYLNFEIRHNNKARNPLFFLP